jgi:Ankyrin repeats (many copies)
MTPSGPRPARPLVPSFEGDSTTVGAWLDAQVELLLDAHRLGERVAGQVLQGSGVVRGTAEEALAADLTPDTACHAIARDHRYRDWSAAREHAREPVDLRFEAAADAIQWGELDVLRDLLDSRPGLVHARGPFPHQATLLHHVAANGIEVERQLQSPANAVHIMRLLLERGAEPDALCTIYSGHDTTMGLLVSSAIPATAGVQAALVEELCRGGANVNGLDDDGIPLWTAISFGYTDAAEALARCGARVDNLVFSAALGDLEAVRRHFEPTGEPPPRRALSAERMGIDGPLLEAGRLVDYALIHAALHSRRDVVAFLLDQGPDLSFREPRWGATALGAARWGGDPEIVELLGGAPQ